MLKPKNLSGIEVNEYKLLSFGLLMSGIFIAPILGLLLEYKFLGHIARIREGWNGSYERMVL